MDNKDIEEKLKNSASKIEMKDFSERWENVGTRIDLYNDGNEKGLFKEPVLVANGGGNVKISNRLKSLWAIAACVILLVGIILAIVLPIVLRKEDNRYFNYNELTEKIVSEDEFNSGIENSGLKIIDLSKYEINSLRLLLTPEYSVVGGSIEITDEDAGILLTINFHTRFVISEYDIGLDYKEHEIGTTCVKYKTTVEDDIYSTVATTTYKDLIYEMEVISLDENILNIFDGLFN